LTRRFQERLAQFSVALVTEILSASPTAYGLALVPHHFAGDKRVAQTTRPSSRDADGRCRLFQAQAVLKRKDNRLSLSQLLNRRRGGHATKRTVNILLTS
jgi:hypothetical protein